MNRNKWSMDTTVKFIRLYKGKECLWNPNSLRYKHRQTRNAALEDIRAKMNVDGLGREEIKSKIRILRSTYYQEKRKIMKSQNTGSGTELYKPNVKWYDDMDEIITNIENGGQYLGNCSHNELEETTEYLDFDMEPENISYEQKIEQPPNEPKPKKPKRDELASIVKVIHGLKDKPQLSDEFDIFGSSVAAQLKKLSDTQAAIAQERIQSILTTCRLNDIRSWSRENSTPSNVNNKSEEDREHC